MDGFQNVILITVFLASCLAVSSRAQANQSPVYKVYGETVTYGDAKKKDVSTFYELDKRAYDRIKEMANQEYLDKFWAKLAKEQKTTAEKAKEKYLKDKLVVDEKEVTEILKKFKDHPQLSQLSAEEQRGQVLSFLNERDKQRVYDEIVSKGFQTGELLVLLPQPEEPVYKLTIGDKEHVRFGPDNADTKPIQCKGDDCPVTVVEYSEFQCPFCGKVIPDTKRVMAEYKGKIRWIVRDFPLDSIHARARPAAIAAKCADKQGKFWDYYSRLFENQRALSDQDLETYAKDLKLDVGKFKKCLASDQAAMTALIDRNFNSGRDFGVTGTPTFFINGRKVSGALGFAEFKRMIDEELTKKK